MSVRGDGGEDGAQWIMQCRVFKKPFLRAEHKWLLGKRANEFYRAGSNRLLQPLCPGQLLW